MATYLEWSIVSASALVLCYFVQELLVESFSVLELLGHGVEVEMLGGFEHAVAVVDEHVEWGG